MYLLKIHYIMFISIYEQAFHRRAEIKIICVSSVTKISSFYRTFSCCHLASKKIFPWEKRLAILLLNHLSNSECMIIDYTG